MTTTSFYRLRSFAFMTAILLGMCALTTMAQWNQQDVQGPHGTTAFGSQIVVLSSGNYFVSDPGYDPGGAPGAGAVFLFDGRTHSAISQLTGSRAGDLVGSGGLYEIGNDRIVVSSPEWSDTAGAATWMEDRPGFNAQVDPSNSIVGRYPNSRVSNYGIILLFNRNFVVVSPNWNNGSSQDIGAVTWGDNNGSTVGVVDSRNSLVGSRSGDLVGVSGVRILRNGNYVVASSFWANRSVTLAGAATWGNGVGGTVGRVSPANSLVGSQSGDRVGSRILTLINSNYVVGSPNVKYGSNSNAGAATWGDGANGSTVGVVSPRNSLLGTTVNEQVGNRIVSLSNGNYVLSTPNWDDPGTGDADVGAVTWGKGVGGTIGNISSSNSFVGTNKNDRVGSGSIIALNNGNYVFASPFWYKELGAVTWGDGLGGNSHSAVWFNNSLTGKTGQDHAGSGGLFALRNGNFVVVSPEWDLNSSRDVGAVTWGDGISGSAGTIESANSITGTSDSDKIGSNGVISLINSAYVISSSLWDLNGDPDVGAATWVDGSGPTSDVVSQANSLTGSVKGDRVGAGGAIALPNGEYAVSSPFWQSYGNDEDGYGAVTWGKGASGVVGDVNVWNSLVGADKGDRVGLGARNSSVAASSNGGFASVLSDSNLVIASPYWGSRGVNADGIGAVTWFDGRGNTTGIADASNSLVGSTAGDLVGDCSQACYTAVDSLQSGQYYVYSSRWDNNGIVDAGAVTLSKAGGISGRIDRFNSVVGTVAGQAQYGGVFSVYPWLAPSGDLFVGVPFENKLTFIGP